MIIALIITSGVVVITIIASGFDFIYKMSGRKASLKEMETKITDLEKRIITLEAKVK